ncbi:MAG TPA: SigB/SigF/SigG family RNA polymerase sigma factor [Streptosporangiaceae bacterium]|jgi:RNA polymerase sigma-B factor|nr:SigB/SigF/SigG family RNA polymerase sigma factor [Streptosporangiaceae bacterium]
MTRTAVRRPVAPALPAQAADPGPASENDGQVTGVCRQDLTTRDDRQLLALVRSEPVGGAARAAACEILVSRYEGLVRACVQRYRDNPESAEELMQVGYIGLIKAINNFDPVVGPSLGAYAQPCISGEIKRHFRDKRWQIRVKRSAQELLLEVRKASSSLAQEQGRTPTDAELAGHLGLSEEELREAKQADMCFHTSSIDAPLIQGQDLAKLADVLGHDDPGLDRAVDMDAVRAHWDELPRRERRILLMRFYGNMTQADIGKRLGISQMHVSRLQAAALGHLRDRLLGTDHDRPYSSCDSAHLPTRQTAS